MLTDLSWFKSLKWILGGAVAAGLVTWFFLFQFPHYSSFFILLEEEFLFLAGMILLTLLGFQVGFWPVEQFINRQSKLNLYLQRINRLGKRFAEQEARNQLFEICETELVEQFPYGSVTIYTVDDEQRLIPVIREEDSKDIVYAPRVVQAMQDRQIIFYEKDSPFRSVQQEVLCCPISGLSGCEFLLLLQPDDARDQEAFHRILGRILAEQVGEALRQVERMEREQAIQDQLNEEIERNTREIRQQQQFLSSILDSLDEGLIVVDSRDQIERINPKALELLDRPPPDTGETLDQFAGALPTEMLQNRSEMTHRSVEVGERVFEFEWHPVSDTEFQLLVIRDRTEMEHLQEQLRINETLSTLGEMASAIVHELRNPLGAMEIYLGLLKRNTDDPKLEKPVHQLEQGFEAIQNTTETLLNYTKTSHADPQEIDPNQLVDSALERCNTSLRNRDVTVNLDLPDLPVIHGDFEQLHHVLVNFIRNGIEAQDESFRLDIMGEADEQEVRLSIVDYGEGMNEQERKNVFKRFFTTKEDGTGLGLAICKRMVEMHSGSIDVESTPGEGSRFTVHLPRNPEWIHAEEEPDND